VVHCHSRVVHCKTRRRATCASRRARRRPPCCGSAATSRFRVCPQHFFRSLRHFITT
jgi:hypothetical protein